jgi:hypothetical protein
MNNWFVIMDGVCLGVGSDWARVYFLVFYFVAVNIAFNTLVSVFLAITSSSGAAAETPVHTIAITKRVEESERAPLKQNQGAHLFFFSLYISCSSFVHLDVRTYDICVYNICSCSIHFFEKGDGVLIVLRPTSSHGTKRVPQRP